MRDRIARALAWVLSVLAPRRPGRHTAEHLAARPAPVPVAVNPWSRPWTSPSREEVQAFFLRQQVEDTLDMGVIRERRRAAVLATMGTDYPYSYPGAPFPASAFVAEGSAA
ncbi:hypothetical protein ACFCY8_26390 [Streptomyces noursei]|uniref:hypothetical protein n=1 Tax=Streptomyces noursei TaxID=1971 RepID=UPI0035D9D256